MILYLSKPPSFCRTCCSESITSAANTLTFNTGYSTYKFDIENMFLNLKNGL